MWFVCQRPGRTASLVALHRTEAVRVPEPILQAGVRVEKIEKGMIRRASPYLPLSTPDTCPWGRHHADPSPGRTHKPDDQPSKSKPGGYIPHRCSC